jgi:hypothetical protein
LINIKAGSRDRVDKGRMSLLRPLLCLVAALALTLSGVALAAATVHGPVTEMVICGDGGAETIRLDARGNPVKGNQCCDCLDCLAMAASLPIPALPGATLPAAVTASPALPVAQRPGPLPCLAPLPRGPPAATPLPCVLPPQAGLFHVALDQTQVPRGKAMPKTGHTHEVAR